MRLPINKERRFPLLFLSGYEVTSPATVDYTNPVYNCIAFAADNQTLWWWPNPGGEAFWPEGIKREVTRSAFVAAFGTIGYEICGNGAAEVGYDKIAIYEKNGIPTHAAKQLEDGRWKSKLGEWEDIEHKTVEAVQTFNGIGLYGEVAVYMKRKRA
jgi:hypothetical protein